MIRFISLLCLITCFLSGYAQLDTCIEEIDDKAWKLYIKGTDKKKNSKVDRVRFLNEAIEEQDDLVDAYFALAMEQIKTAKYKGSSFNPALENLEKVHNLCPSYHSDVSYYMSVIYLGKKEYCKAVELSDFFLNYQHTDENRFSKNYSKNIDEAKLDYEFAKFYCDWYTNPVPFDPIRVNKLSTRNDEYLPWITPDNKFMYFTRKSKKENPIKNSPWASDIPEYVEQFAFAKRTDINLFEEGKAMPFPFNQDEKMSYGGITTSIDNKHLFITICKEVMINGPKGPQLYPNCDIYSSDYVFGLNEWTGREEWFWTEPVTLGDNVNGKTSFESQPTLAGDGKTLYFASFREDSEGIDIYRTKRMGNGKWSKAENMGKPINTEYHDKSPFIHSDSQTLYYSSQRPLGFGGYDVFYTRKEKGAWTEPKNLGHPINTEKDEHGFVVSTDGKRVYYGSGDFGDKINGLDIYSFELYKEARPEKVALITGHITDDKGKPAKNVKVSIKGMQTKNIKEIEVDSMDGGYAAIVKIKKDQAFIVEAKGEDIAFNTKMVTLADSEDSSVFKPVEVQTHNAEVGESYRLDNIYYETSSADIIESSKIMLEEFVLYLIEHPTIKIEVHGHTDNIGDFNKNYALSADRAYSVMAHLQSLGVQKDRLKFKGFGPTKPVASNNTEEGRSQNRRTEFLILSK